LVLGEDYQQYPRPGDNYFEERHRYLTQGDIVADLLWGQIGPEVRVVQSVPEGVAVPEGTIPILTFAHFSRFGIILSDTCDFRHPSATEIDQMQPGPFGPRTVYHSGFVRVAPIKPLNELGLMEEVVTRIRTYDHFRKLMYLPAFSGGAAAFLESVIMLDRADLMNLDYISRLTRVTQLTLAGRKQLNRKLVYADTGYHVSHERFNPSLS
jgi:hypothetical protein